MNKNAEEKLLNIIGNDELVDQLKKSISLDKDIEISNFIFSSKKYDSFNRLAGNRDIDPKNVKKLTNSIKANGYKKSQPIILDEDFNIIDGQHRFRACQDLGLPVYFTIEKTDDSLKLTQDLNKDQKNWSIIDYVKSYSERKFEDYNRLLKLIQDENITTSSAIWLIKRSRNGNVQQQIRKGTFKCSEEDVLRARLVLNKIRELKESIPNNFPEEKKLRSVMLTDRIIVPLMCMMEEENYNHKRMLKQIKELYRSIDTRSMVTAGESLIAIYNLKLNKSSNKRLRPYSEISQNPRNKQEE